MLFSLTSSATDLKPRPDRCDRLGRIRLVRRLLAVLLVLLVLVPAGAAAGAESTRAARVMLGRSERGRPIVAIHTGSPHGLRVLVVGCIHGTECAGIPIARALARV